MPYAHVINNGELDDSCLWATLVNYEGSLIDTEIRLQMDGTAAKCARIFSVDGANDDLWIPVHGMPQYYGVYYRLDDLHNSVIDGSAYAFTREETVEIPQAGASSDDELYEALLNTLPSAAEEEPQLSGMWLTLNNVLSGEYDEEEMNRTVMFVIGTILAAILLAGTVYVLFFV